LNGNNKNSLKTNPYYFLYTKLAIKVRVHKVFIIGVMLNAVAMIR